METERISLLGHAAWYHINKTYLPIKACYTFLYAAVGCLIPFIPLYASQLEFSASEIGLMYGTYPFLATTTLLVIGAIADKFQCHKGIMILCIVCHAVSIELLLLVPSRTIKLTTKIETYIHCHSSSYISDCIASERDSRALKCPFRDYISTINMNGTKNRPNFCEVSCERVGTHVPNTQSSACFSNTSIWQAVECYTFNQQSEKRGFTFSIQNIYDLIHWNNTHDKQYEFANVSQLDCAEFDLNNLVYQDKNFRNLFCEKRLTLRCLLSCKIFVMGSCAESFSTPYDPTFWIFFSIFLFGHLWLNPAITILDAVSYNILGEKRHKWGQQRLFGALSYAVCAVSSSFIMDNLRKIQEGVDYSVSFYTFGSLCFFTCITSYCFHIPKDFKCSNYVKNIRRVLENLEFVVFLGVTFCFGCLGAALTTFLYLFLESLGATKLLIGINVVVESCIIEVPMLFLSGTIIKRLGHLPCLYVTCVAYFVRFLGYSLLTNPWYALLLAPLHGITYGLCWAACTYHVSVIAPKDITASAQGIISGLHFGIGKGTGSLVTGVMVEKLGLRWTFRALAMFTAILLVFYATLNTFYFKSHRNRESKQEYDQLETAEGGKLQKNTDDGVSNSNQNFGAASREGGRTNCHLVDR